MKYRSLSLLITILLLLATLAVAATEKPTATIFGRVENIYLMPQKIKLSAKLDTGAKTSSLYATHLHYFTRAGKPWVRFTIPKTKYSAQSNYEASYVGTSKIKLHPTPELKNSEEARPVVMMTICIGNQIKSIVVNLSDRKGFSYPMLLGRQGIIQFNGVIDPSRALTQPRCSR